MSDWLTFTGGVIFLTLAGLSYFKRDWIWKLYSLDSKWRRKYPERTPEWDEKTRRYSVIYLVVGLIFIALGL